jgi:thermitase
MATRDLGLASLANRGIAPVQLQDFLKPKNEKAVPSTIWTREGNRSIPKQENVRPYVFWYGNGLSGVRAQLVEDQPPMGRNESLMLKKYFIGTLILAATFIALHAEPVGVVKGRILMKAKPGAGIDAIAGAVKAFGGSEVDQIPGLGIRILQIPDRAWNAALEGLQRNPIIEFAEPDYILAPDGTANDPYYGSQWHLSKIEANTAWDTTVGSSTVILAVLDTGVESSHPDLSGRLVAGWNFYNGNSDTSDVHGHGTAVAGTAAASSNNGMGVAGVAGGCKIMPIRISDPDGYAYESTIAKALNWAANNGARVANISFRASNSSTIKTAAQYFQSKAGVVVISSGNEGLFDSTGDNPYVLTVSATDSADSIAYWSNTGNNIDLAAPGVNILTTATGGNYAWCSGTSFSAPIVAGAAALVISAQPSLTGTQASEVLKKTADDFGAAGFDTQYGWGRVNVSKAVTLALALSVPVADTTAPFIKITSPTEGSAVGNSVYVYVNASDNVAVKKVELYVDGRYVGYSASSSFTIRWDAKKASRGAHKLQTKALDAAGNAGWSQVVTVYR